MRAVMGRSWSPVRAAALAGRIHVWRDALALALLLALSAPARGEEVTSGLWAGGYDTPTARIPVMARFETGGSGVRGSFYLLLERGRTMNLDGPAPEAAHLEFQAFSGTDTLNFSGDVRGDTILGAVRSAALNPNAKFQLVRFREGSGAHAGTLQGDYDLGRRTLFIRALGSLLRYEDTGSGRFGLLFPSSDSTYFGGPSYLTTYPVEIQATFRRDGRGLGSALTFSEPGSPPREAPRIQDYAVQNVEFPSGGLQLAAALFIPLPHPEKSPAAKLPAIVLVHSSSEGPRDSFGTLPSWLALQGFEVLAADKRGSGKSGKGRGSASFLELADDVAAAVQFLKSRPEVDSTRIGLVGESQGGGYTAPMAAARHKDIAFLVNLSGSCVTPAEENLFQSEIRMKREGYSDEAVAHAAGLQMRLHDYTRRGGDRKGLVAELQQSRPEKWYALTNLPGDPEQELPPPERVGGSWWHETLDLDRMPDWEKVTCPVLCLYGDRDDVIPVPEGIERFRKAQAKAGNTRSEIHVLPGATHDLWQAPAGRAWDVARTRGYAPGFRETVAKWLSTFLADPTQRIDSGTRSR